VNLRPAVGPRLCLVVTLAAVAGCGGSGPSATTTTTTATTAPPVRATPPPASASAATHEAPQPSVPLTPSHAGGCDQAVSTLAAEKRIAAPERAALEALITALARHPVALKCASSQITILGTRPAGSKPPGRTDDACLAAADDVRVLEMIPGLAAPVQQAARLAGAIIDQDEQHGSMFCVIP
jgi:hypothetical protein